VIDLLKGQVVRAVRGDRQSYRPIVSTLCDGSDPLTMARALCDRCGADQLYVADLDALMGGQAQIEVLRALLHGLPDMELWVDAGFADVAGAMALQDALGPQAGRLVPVFGSESLVSRAALAACGDGAGSLAGRAALSLDRRDGVRMDAAGCWDAPELWPQRVIVMTLERVGSAAGPDLETMREVRRRAPRATLIGAGGVRTAADLAQARTAGADGWLVASALHDGQLSRPRR
jgi:phosphoribosylformimino-5-aminoimidazole carboxamide ribotide isomerase